MCTNIKKLLRVTRLHPGKYRKAVCDVTHRCTEKYYLCFNREDCCFHLSDAPAFVLNKIKADCCQSFQYETAEEGVNGDICRRYFFLKISQTVILECGKPQRGTMYVCSVYFLK